MCRKNKDIQMHIKKLKKKQENWENGRTISSSLPYHLTKCFAFIKIV